MKFQLQNMINGLLEAQLIGKNQLKTSYNVTNCTIHNEILIVGI